MPAAGIRAVLFDLDGTLADTAPDLAGALDRLLAEEGRPPLPFERARAAASAGAPGLIGAGFGIAPGEVRFEGLRTRFLDLYAASICVRTRLFDGMPGVIDTLEQCALPWGIVTNKAARFTVPLARALALTARSACLVSGDTTPRLKPAPDSLLHAARLLDLAPGECLYVGDDLRDVQAARAAGMAVLAAGWGYLDGSDPSAWGADAVLSHPSQVLKFLGIAPSVG
ncbi:MAG: HAD-IA family hydrolase [Burkholderiales bacterium]|nr:HAD-IA family hydrolase [Burkholderiales bacterium]